MRNRYYDTKLILEEKRPLQHKLLASQRGRREIEKGGGGGALTGKRV